MGAPIQVKRETIEDLRPIVPLVAASMQARGVVAAVTLKSAKAIAYAYEGASGSLALVHGSRALCERYARERAR